MLHVWLICLMTKTASAKWSLVSNRESTIFCVDFFSSCICLSLVQQTWPAAVNFWQTVFSSWIRINKSQKNLTLWRQIDVHCCGGSGTMAAAPPPFRPGEPALCGSCPLITLLCCIFVSFLGGTAAAAPPPFRHGEPALCGSHP